MQDLVLNGLAPLSATKEEIEEVSASGSYLPRLQLMTSSSNKCKDGSFPVNKYACIEGDNYIELEKEIDVLVLDYHPKALDMSGEGVVISSYDVKSPLFQEIAEKADVKDSKCTFGPEYLVYIPSVKKYATFYLNSKSSRRECSRPMDAQMRKAATLKSKLIDTKKYTWQCPVVVPCSNEFEIPEIAEINEKLQLFKDSTKAPEPELAPETEGRAR